MNSSSEPDYWVPLKNPNGIPSYSLQKYRRKSVRVLDLESVYINARQKHPKGRARVVVNMKYTLYNIIIFANKRTLQYLGREIRLIIYVTRDMWLCTHIYILPL